MTSRVVRLARLLELKYGLLSLAAPDPERVLAEVKRDILDAYRNYFSRAAKDSMFQYAADLGQPQAVALTTKMDKLVKDLDKTPAKLIKSLNELLAIMYQMKQDPDKSVRQAIHDSVPSSTEAQRNTRQRVLSKYERSISMAFPALQKAAVKLQQIIPDVAVHGGEIARERAELSKQQLINFVLATPAFRNAGLDSLEIVEQILTEPDLKHRLTTLVNAVNRGQHPLDAPAISDFANQVKARLAQRQENNQSFFNTNEPLPSPQKDEEEE